MQIEYIRKTKYKYVREEPKKKNEENFKIYPRGIIARAMGGGEEGRLYPAFSTDQRPLRYTWFSPIKRIIQLWIRNLPNFHFPTINPGIIDYRIDRKKSASAPFFRFGFKNYSLVIKFIPNENLCLLFARINLYSEKSKKFSDEKEKKNRSTVNARWKK